MSQSRRPRYFLKSVGMAADALPVRWWEERLEIVENIYFNREPKAISVGDTLIYYAVGSDGRLCGVAEVTGDASQDFHRPSLGRLNSARNSSGEWQCS